MKPVHSFGFVAFKDSQIVKDTFERVIRWSEDTNTSIVLHPELRTRVKEKHLVAATESDFLAASEAVVSVGGDGTFLSVAHMCRFSEKPVIGINLGGLGFLTDISISNIETNLTNIKNGEYTTISRMVLEASLIRQDTRICTFQALNDVFINRINIPKLTSISAWFGNDFITEFFADGLIVATPSGSTAYSLSAGGPIIEPAVKAFLLTPICPHSLTERPIILPSDKNIRLLINEKNPDLLLSADGLQSIKLVSGDQIIISYGGIKTNLIQLTECSFFSLLRHKLDWGRGYKQRSNHDS